MSDQTQFKHVSSEELENACLSMYARMVKDGYKPDVIIGLLKGGGYPASLFVDYFGVSMEFATLRTKSYDGIGEQRPEVTLFPHYDKESLVNKKVLVVDDIWDTGKTMLGMQCGTNRSLHRLETLNTRSKRRSISNGMIPLWPGARRHAGTQLMANR